MATIKWFARGGGIARMGPFDTEIEAWKSMRLALPGEEETMSDFPRAGLFGDAKKRSDEDVKAFPYPTDIVVWPEEVGS